VEEEDLALRKGRREAAANGFSRKRRKKLAFGDTAEKTGDSRALSWEQV